MNNYSMESQILEFINSLQDPANFTFYVVILLAIFFLTWIAVTVWAVKDATSRSNNLLFIFFSGLLVLVTGILGLVIYLLIRPSYTKDEKDHQKLLEASIFDSSITSCPDCGNLARKEHKYCAVCNCELQRQCPECKTITNPHWNYCIECGYTLFDNRSYYQRIKEVISTKMIQIKGIPGVFNSKLSTVRSFIAENNTKKKNDSIFTRIGKTGFNLESFPFTYLSRPLLFTFRLPSHFLKLVKFIWSKYIKLIEKGLNILSASSKRISSSLKDRINKDGSETKGEKAGKSDNSSKSTKAAAAV